MSVLLAILFAVLLGIVPMVLFAVLITWFDRYEKEPPLLMLGVFLWGFVVAAGSALVINTLFGVGIIFATGSEALANIGTAVLVAPPVEETVKGLAVLGVFLFFRHEFDSVLDGVIYGCLVGFGFAAAENINYILSGYGEQGMAGLLIVALVRILLIPFLHAMLTAFTGIGLAVARLSTGVICLLAPILGYMVAVGAHSFHNLLASLGNVALCFLGSLIDWAGFAGVFVLILLLVWREGKVMRDHLHEEIGLGNLTAAQYQAASSVFGQLVSRWGALGTGRWGQTGRFYSLCGELAFKKYHLARLGPEREHHAPALIEKLRQEIASLSRGV